MPEGGRLTISVREEGGASDDHADTARFLCLSVVDEGEGMDAETVAKAVEPFFTTKGIGKGTGLGLSTVQGFAEQSGGRLTLTSRRGDGTRVEIWLPVEDEHTELAATPDDPVPENRTGCGALRVLAVDDDALVLMNTAAMLEDLGHVVTEAFSGDAALRLMREGHEFDLVITDHAMPRMTGMDLARALRTEWPRLPIVMATGYAELPEGNVLNLPKLSKPFDQAQLDEAVAAAVSTRFDASVSD